MDEPFLTASPPDSTVLATLLGELLATMGPEDRAELERRATHTGMIGILGPLGLRFAADCLETDAEGLASAALFHADSLREVVVLLRAIALALEEQPRERH